MPCMQVKLLPQKSNCSGVFLAKTLTLFRGASKSWFYSNFFSRGYELASKMFSSMDGSNEWPGMSH